MDITPVDYVAKALVHISLSDENLNRVYQFPHPTLPLWSTVFEFMREYGYPLEWMKSGEWERHLLEVIRSGANGAENALAPFAPVVANFEAYAEQASAEGHTGQMKHILFDDRNTRAAIAGSGIHCPEVDADLLTVYFDFFVRTGFLPPPPAETGVRVGEEATAGV